MTAPKKDTCLKELKLPQLCLSFCEVNQNPDILAGPPSDEKTTLTEMFAGSLVNAAE